MLLTVCIPTFNRLAHLKNQIHSLVHQIKINNLESDIEILISENTNVRDHYVKNNFLKSFKNIKIKIIRNKKNIGYAKSLNNLIINAKGKFSWFLSDDDTISAYAIISIVSAFKNNNDADYFTFRCNGEPGNSNSKKDLYFSNISKKNKENIYYLIDGKKFLKKYWLSVIFLSLNVFNTKKMTQHLKRNNFFKNINHAYHNSYLCLSFIANVKVCIILKSLLTDSYADKHYDISNRFEMLNIYWLKLVADLSKFKLPFVTIFQMRMLSLRNLKLIFKYLVVDLYMLKNYQEIMNLLKKCKTKFILEKIIIFLMIIYVKFSKYFLLNKLVIFFFSDNFIENKIKNFFKNKKIFETLKKKKMYLTFKDS